MKTLNENELKKIVGGMDTSQLLTELIFLTNQYPEIQDIIDSYDRGDLDNFYIMLSNLEYNHPELGYLFQ